MTKEELKQLPKVELHCHLDGSLSRNFIEKRLGRQVSQEELPLLMKNAVDTAFAADEVKAELYRKLGIR